MNEIVIIVEIKLAFYNFINFLLLLTSNLFLFISMSHYRIPVINSSLKSLLGFKQGTQSFLRKFAVRDS